MTKLRVTVTRHITAGRGLTFPYDPRFIQAIKTRVKSTNRTYDPATRTWWLHRDDDLANLQSATNGWVDFVGVNA